MDSTSYCVTLPVNELFSPPVTLKEFTVFFSSNVLTGPANAFIFVIEEYSGALSLFMIKNSNYIEVMSDTIKNDSNALLLIGDPSEVNIGTYLITFFVITPPTFLKYPLANFTVNIVEGKSNFS